MLIFLKILTKAMAYGTRNFNVTSQGLSKNPFPKPRIDLISLRYILIFHSDLCLAFTRGLYPVGLPDIIMEVLPHFSILAICRAHLNLLHLMNLTTLD